ncbi:MAG: hypothetical protein VX698_10310, partial [Pseudomonadota bacterium]|nr:hypothetical protein [Pseudomonadota bacterium]
RQKFPSPSAPDGASTFPPVKSQHPLPFLSGNRKLNGSISRENHDFLEISPISALYLEQKAAFDGLRDSR